MNFAKNWWVNRIKIFEVKFMENNQLSIGDNYFEPSKVWYRFKYDFMPPNVSNLRLVKVDISWDEFVKILQVDNSIRSITLDECHIQSIPQIPELQYWKLNSSKLNTFCYIFMFHNTGLETARISNLRCSLDKLSSLIHLFSILGLNDTLKCLRVIMKFPIFDEFRRTALKIYANEPEYPVKTDLNKLSNERYENLCMKALAYRLKKLGLNEWNLKFKLFR